MANRMAATLDSYKRLLGFVNWARSIVSGNLPAVYTVITTAVLCVLMALPWHSSSGDSGKIQDTALPWL
jgi:hypothetical protein